MLKNIQMIAFGVVLVLGVGGIGLWAYKWHYEPLKAYEKQVSSLERELYIIGSALNVCEANLSKQKLQGFIDGIGEIDDENITNDLNNLHT